MSVASIGMRHLVIGTAGHIDHGKSTLVQALTGIDPDRLKEEKARGITIDLGFAHTTLAPGGPADAGGDVHVAFVDVPGHERFVRNMLAGATGIDAVLLVVAADESVMPQTREHFDICRLLDVRRGVIVLTKRDLADAEMTAIAREDVRELVAGSFLADAPIIEVSARTGEGLDALRHALRTLARGAPERATRGGARLPIDRAFSMKGFGAVVTGTLASGALRVEDEVELLPAGRRVRVRGLQVHGARVREAASGQRVAVNLADVDAAEITRGETLASPGTLESTLRCDTVVTLLESARPLRHGARVRFHQGTREVMGRIAVSSVVRPVPVQNGEAEAGDASSGAVAGGAGVTRDAASGAATHGAATHGAVTDGVDPNAAAAGSIAVPEGGRAFARLRFESPVVLTRGDRFVLRAYSPVTTIGGGIVLDPRPPRGALRTAAARARFTALDPGDGASVRDASAIARALRVMLDEAGREGLPIDRLVTRAGLARDEAEALATTAVADGRAVRVGDRLLSATVFSRLADALVELVAHHHKTQPESHGLPREEARDRIDVAPKIFDRLLEQVTAGNRLAGRDRLALPGYRVAAPDVDDETVATIERLLSEAGLKPPDAAELAARGGIPPATVERVLTLLVRQRRLVKVATLFFHPAALERLKEETRALKTSAPAGARVTVDVARFKTRYDVSRKFAIPLLEYLDRERVTRRVGDERLVL